MGASSYFAKLLKQAIVLLTDILGEESQHLSYRLDYTPKGYNLYVFLNKPEKERPVSEEFIEYCRTGKFPKIQVRDFSNNL